MKRALMFLFVFMLVFVPGSLIMSGCILTDLYWSVEGGNNIQGFDRVEAPTGEVNKKNGKTYISQGSSKVLEFYFDYGWDIAEEDRDNFVMLNGNYHNLRTDAISSKYHKVYHIFFDYQYKHKVKVTFNKDVVLHKIEMPVKMVWRGDGDNGSIMPYDIKVSICNMTESDNIISKEFSQLDQTEEVILEDTVNYGQKYQIDLKNGFDYYYNLDMIELEYPEGGGAGVSTLTKTVGLSGAVTYDLVLERDTIVVFSQKKFVRLRQNIDFEYVEGEYEMVKGALEMFSFTKEDDSPVMIADFPETNSTVNLKVKCTLIDDPRFEGCYDNLFNALTINGKTLDELEIPTPTITDGAFVIPIKRPYLYFGEDEYVKGLGDRFTNYKRIVFSADCISKVLAKNAYAQTEMRFVGDFNYNLGSARYIAINENIVHNSSPKYDACKENKQEIVFARKGSTQYFFPLSSTEYYAGMQYFVVVDLPEDMHFTYIVGDGSNSRYHYVFDEDDDIFNVKPQYCEGWFCPDPYYNSADNNVYIMIDRNNIHNMYGTFSFGAIFNE